MPRLSQDRPEIVREICPDILTFTKGTVFLAPVVKGLAGSCLSPLLVVLRY